MLPPSLTANKAVIINSAGTGMTLTTGSLALAGGFTTTGAFDTTLVQGASITLILPIVSGLTIATLTGTEALTNKTYNGNTWTAGTGVLTIAAAKTLTVSNTLTFTGTDSSSVAFGAGGTVLYSGGAYVSSIAGTAAEITASAATGAVTLSLPAALTFTGKTVTGGTFASPTISGTVAGAHSYSGAITMSAALTYGGVTLSNAVTGTGNMVLSASPTLTGTLTAAAANFSGNVSVTGAAGITSFTGTTPLGLTVKGSTSTNDYSGLDFIGDGLSVPIGRIAVLAGGGGSSMKFGVSDSYGSGVTKLVLTLDQNQLATFAGAINYGGVTLSNSVTGTGSMVLSASPTLTGTTTMGTTNITTSGATVLTVTSSGTGNGVTISFPNGAGTAASIVNSGLATMDFNYSGTKFMAYNGVTGYIEVNSAIKYGGVGLANSVTGTGSMVLSASPTLTGTLTAPALTFSGTSATYATFKWSGSTLGTLTTDGTSIFQNTVTGSTYNVVSGGSGGVSLINAATSWSALSRRELKTGFAPITDALERVKAHAAEIGRYKTDPEDVRRAFLFREDAEKYWPYAAHGENELALADYVPLLVKAFQELIFRVERLESK